MARREGGLAADRASFVARRGGYVIGRHVDLITSGRLKLGERMLPVRLLETYRATWKLNDTVLRRAMRADFRFARRLQNGWKVSS